MADSAFYFSSFIINCGADRSCQNDLGLMQAGVYERTHWLVDGSHATAQCHIKRRSRFANCTWTERHVSIDCSGSCSCFHTDRCQDETQDKTRRLYRLFMRWGNTFKLTPLSDAYQSRRGSWGNRALYRVGYLAGFMSMVLFFVLLLFFLCLYFISRVCRDFTIHNK